jgi:sulfate transport system ATP-binding protein
MGITVSNVSKRFGSYVALDDVSLEVPNGSLTALLGPSGSGKSTLLRIIAGLEKPDSGSVSILDQDATSLPVQKRGVGFVFQHYAAFKHMTVYDNVAFGLSIRHRPKAEIRKRVSDLLKLVQLDGFAERYPSQLSGGQRQRMALARALAVQPKVLLLDEPFGALDAQVRKELRDWLRRLHEEMPVTTVLVTHDQEEAMDVASRIVVMNHARIEQVGSPESLYDHPANEFVMSFIGQVNQIGDSFIRPHDIAIARSAGPDTEEARIERLVHLGFEVRVELVRPDGHALHAQITREEARRLDLRTGETIHISLGRARVFDSGTGIETTRAEAMSVVG